MILLIAVIVVTRRLCEVEAGLAGSLKFAKSERLGFLGASYI